MLDYDLEKISETYFNGVKTKHLREFDEVTPEGNHIQGIINRQSNFHLGSLLILSVNDEKVEQFVQSMPKIHYFKEDEDIMDDYNVCYEKLDGSCLILYPLHDSKGDLIEIVPKTRGRAVADAHFQELYNKVDHKPIREYYSRLDNINDVLIFELYGILNQHEIIHYNAGVDINLISIVKDSKKFINDVFIVEDLFHFKLPDAMFYLVKEDDTDYWRVLFTSKKYQAYRGYFDDSVKYPSKREAVLGLKHSIELLNEKYRECNDRLATEGVVINTRTQNGFLKFLKCKPREIEEKCSLDNGIPKSVIRKEVFKYFDEYGDTVKDLYNSNPEHHTEYLHRMLSEEYDEQFILKSKKRIESVFMKEWDNREVPVSIHNLCEELMLKYGDEGITYCMRMFAEEYPSKKKDSRTVYSTLEKLFHKNDLKL